MLIPVLISGAVASIVFCGLVFWSWWSVPEVWLADVTNGEVKPPNKGMALVVMIAVAASMLLGAIAAAWWLAGVTETTFLDRFIAAYLVIGIIMAVDLFIVDILIYMWIYPPFMRYEDIEPLHSYWEHTKGSLIGMVIGLPMALIAAAIGGLA
jgi:MFS family permease